MRRTRISRTNVKVVSTEGTTMTFYLQKSLNVAPKRKTVYDLFKN